MSPHADGKASSTELSIEDRRPKCGLGVFVLDAENRFLMGKRKGSNGAGTYALPGGHLEFQESFEGCGARELQEETGLQIPTRDFHFLTCTNNILVKDGGKHYVTVFMVAHIPEGQKAENLEPEKCEGWEWVSWPQLLDWIQAEKGVNVQPNTYSQQSTSRILFPPMVTLVETRPGVRPELALP